MGPQDQNGKTAPSPPLHKGGAKGRAGNEAWAPITDCALGLGCWPGLCLFQIQEPQNLGAREESVLA